MVCNPSHGSWYGRKTTELFRVRLTCEYAGLFEGVHNHSTIAPKCAQTAKPADCPTASAYCTARAPNKPSTSVAAKKTFWTLAFLQRLGRNRREKATGL